jgi:hypothetical protein
MARTTEAIYQELLAEKQSKSSLNPLNSTSATAVWRLWLYISASGIAAHEALWERAQAALNTQARSLQVGTPSWYVAKAREYRVGDSLEVNPITFQVEYPSTATGEQIIRYAAISGIGVSSVLKVAKEVATVPTPLTSGELDAFRTYIDRLQFAGSQIVSQSLAADTLRLTAELYYDGSFVEADLLTAVNAAINDYLRNLPFNGRIITNALIDAVQAVEGVRDFYITSFEGKNAVADVFAPIGRSYTPLAGYALFELLTITPFAE